MRKLILIAPLLLSGCAGSVLGDAVAGPEAVAAREDSYCRSIGTRFGTPEYANCRMTVSNQRQQGHRAAIQSLNAPQMAPRSAPRQCISRNVGGQVITDCE